MRLFLRLTLSLLVSLAVGCSSQAKAVPTSKIVVVGAGLAGLTAAHRLQTMGHIVDVYEARGRPGGRVCTAYFGEAYEELGGKNFYDGGEASTLFALVDELGLTATPYQHNPTQFFLFDSTIYETPFQHAPPPNDLLFDELAHSARTLEEGINAFLHDYPLANIIANTIMMMLEGSPTHQLDSAYMTGLFHSTYQKLYKIDQSLSRQEAIEAPWCCVDGGNYRLIEALAKTLQGHLHLNMPLDKLSRDSQQRWHLTFRDGSETVCDYLIIATPCSTLRDVQTPTGLFPEDQTIAIHTLQYGTHGKILLPIAVEKETAPNFIVNKSMCSWFDQDYSVMTCFFGANAGIFDARSTEALTQRIQEELPTIQYALPMAQFPMGLEPVVYQDALIAHYTHPIGISWIHEEFSKGSYSNFGVGQYAFFHEEESYFGETVRKVFRPIDNSLFFAGEHTALEISATLEGAAVSGEKAARMVHQAIMNTTSVLFP